MRWALLAPCGLAFATVAACGNEPQQPAQNEAMTTEADAEQNQVAPLDPADIPPPIVRSPAYRCDDGKALYVDVLQDKQAVLVRDSRSDVPTRLERESDSGPLTGDGISLSGTGSEVRYSSPDRPSQACREAAG